MPPAFEAAGLYTPRGAAADLAPVGGPGVVISGSCSRATNEQVRIFTEKYGGFQIDPLALIEGRDLAGEALAWAAERWGKSPILVYATAEPEAVRKAQEKVGRDVAGAMVESALATITEGLVAAGARQVVVAGGETSGAIVQRLGVEALRIGPEIDPGVPWCVSVGASPIALALKSGNFGAPDFFEKALKKAP